MFVTDHATRPGECEVIEPGIRAITAPNGGPMTFTGTRTYLVGEGAVALIDPGPRDPAHAEAVLAALKPGEHISHILVTHSHIDHSPLAGDLAARTGAEVLAFGAHGAGMSDVMRALSEATENIGGGEGGDADFRPDRHLADGESVEGQGWTLTALHTPGHLSNHLCFALEGTGVLFSGDHVMGWATTMVSPPDGDLSAFMGSLTKVAARDDRLYLPGHGAPIENPKRLVEHIFNHRKLRERQILDCLAKAPATPADLTADIYESIDRRLWPAASRNVLAHLIDLHMQGRVAADPAIGQASTYSLS